MNMPHLTAPPHPLRPSAPFAVKYSQRSGPLHLYIHIPYCARKCPYCDFNSHTAANPPWGEYQAALLRDLDWWLAHPAYCGRQIETIFFGGGTPSLAPAELIAACLQRVAPLIASDAEISLEANPGTTEAGRFSAYRQAGVNRLSIGAQSFNDVELRWLERIHSATETVAAVQAARQAGFENLNLDLIYGLPGQSFEQFSQSLEAALALTPEHLSCYQLTVEEGTALAKRQRSFQLPDEDESLRLFSETRQWLAESGYEAYEISNFSRPGFACRHNDGYWRYHDYIGIGAGAIGKYDLPDGGMRRYGAQRNPATYIRATAPALDVAREDSLDQQRAAAEALWIGLRRKSGVSRGWFRERFGSDPWQLFADRLAPHINAGRLICDDDALRLTQSGLVLADLIGSDIL